MLQKNLKTIRKISIFGSFLLLLIFGRPAGAEMLYLTGAESATLLESVAAIGSTQIQSEVVRTGDYSFQTNPSQDNRGFFTFAGLDAQGNFVLLNEPELNVRFYFLYNIKPGNNREVFFTTVNDEGKPKLELHLDDNGRVQILNYAGELVATSNSALEKNKWYEIDISIGTGSSAPYEFFINDVLEASGATDLGRSNNQAVTLGKSFNTSDNRVDFFFDDIAYDDSDLPPSGRIKMLLVNGNGDDAGFENGSGSSDFEQLKEAPHDGNATHVAENNPPDTVSYSLEDTDSKNINGPINSLLTMSVAAKVGKAQVNYAAGLKSGQNFDETLIKDLPENWSLGAFKIHPTDPNSGLSWTTESINSLEIGLTSSGEVGGVKVTAAYVMVDYNAPDIAEDNNTWSEEELLGKSGLADGIWFQNKKIITLYTDDNTGEDLLIYSDRQNYGGSDTVYFTVTNISSLDQNVLLAGMYPQNANYDYEIKELKPGYPVDEEYEECDGEYIEIDKDNFQCSRPLAKKTRTVHKDISDPLPPAPKTSPYNGRTKPLPPELSANGHYKTFLKANETKYFVLNHHFPISLGQENLKEFYIEAYGEAGAFGSLDPWYNASWTYRVSVTIQATEVDADLTDFPVYVNLNNLPAEFHTNVNQTDARDIRVTTADGQTEVPRQVVFYTAASDTGELHFKGNVDATTDTVFYIYYGNAAASEPAADSTYGSQNVWTNYAAVYHSQDASGDLTDSTVNDLDLAVAAGTPTYSATGKIGFGIDKAATAYFATTTVAAVNTAPYSMSIWAESDDNTIFQGLMTVGADNLNFAQLTFQGTGVNDPVGIRVRNATVNQFVSVVGFTQDAFGYAVAVVTSNTLRNVYINNTKSANSTTEVIPTAWTLTRVGMPGNSATLGFDGVLDEARFADFAYSDAWIDSEYSNQNTPLTFYAVGAQEENAATNPEGTLETKGFIKIKSLFKIK